MRMAGFRCLVIQSLCLLTCLVALNVSDFPNDTVFWTTRTNNLVFNQDIPDWLTSSKSPQFKALSITYALSTDGIALDIPRGLMVTSDAQLRVLYIHDLQYGSAYTFLLGTSADVGEVTIDWRARNVYWADRGFGWIAMKPLPKNISRTNSFDPHFKLVVDKYLNKPTGMVVHPNKHFLFWADAGKFPKIERSNLIGQTRTLIAWRSVLTPTSVCVDETSNRLYWSDPTRGTIEYTDYDGNSRTILASSSDYDFYGLAIFKNVLLFTSPKRNTTGYVSLSKNIEGQRPIYSLKLSDFTLYQMAAFDPDLQPRALLEGCDSEHIGCDQICVHMPVDRGGTCFCQDGYKLDERDGKTCNVDGKVLERHLMFTNGNEICGVPISVLGINTQTPSSSYVPSHCDAVSSDSKITRFALDMTQRIIFFTDGKQIFRQTAFDKFTKSLLYTTNQTIIDMDYNWKTMHLYWVEANDSSIYYKNLTNGVSDVTEKKSTSSRDVISIAVDPHNMKIFWIDKTNSTVLHVWNLQNGETPQVIKTVLLRKPTDLEYDRLNNRLLWNDELGFIGIININGTEEKKYDNARTTGKSRHAITVYKHFIVWTTGENRQFDILYELNPDVNEHLNLSISTGEPVLDVHVFESTLQPSDLEPCEVNNGGCKHICLPEGTTRCACYHGYYLDADRMSCKSVVLDSNYYVAIDKLHKSLYQIERTNLSTYKIEIDESNEPLAMAFDFSRKEVIWTDAASHSVKKKALGQADEKAVYTGINKTASVAVDYITGNIFVSKNGQIVSIDHSKRTTTIVVSDIQGTVGKLALMPAKRKIAWFETGTVMRMAVAHMDVSVPPIVLPSGEMQVPEDILFDIEDGDYIYWCDSELDKIEKINIESLTKRTVYSGYGLRPVSMDIDEHYIYLAPKDGRQIVRINKTDGGSQEVVFESPLFGTFNDFYLSRYVFIELTVSALSNTTATTVTTEDLEPKPTSTPVPGRPLPIVAIAAGAGGGGAALIIVIVAIVCIYQRWRRSKKPQNDRDRLESGRNGRDLYGYADANGVLSPDPPPRPQPAHEEEVYTHLEESQMIDMSKITVDLPPRPDGKDVKAQEMTLRGSSSSGRYSKFPGNDVSYGYLTPFNPQEVPKEDYPTDDDNYDNTSDGGYLSASITGSQKTRQFPSLNSESGIVRSKAGFGPLTGSGMSNTAFVQHSDGGMSGKYNARAERNVFDDRNNEKDKFGYLELSDSSRARLGDPPRGHTFVTSGSTSSGYATKINKY